MFSFDRFDRSGLLVLDDINPAPEYPGDPLPEDFDEDFGWSRDERGVWSHIDHSVTVDTDRVTGDRYTVSIPVDKWGRREGVRTLLDETLALALADLLARRSKVFGPWHPMKTATELRRRWRNRAEGLARVVDHMDGRRFSGEFKFPPARRAPARRRNHAVALPLAAE